MSPNLTVESVLDSIRGMKVLVIGDMMLDVSIWYKTLGRASEFDGNILVEDRRINYPGGAANVAMNCKALGADVTLLGAYGTDRAGLNLVSTLQSNLIKVPTTTWDNRKWWGTTTKTRVYVDDVPLHRIDKDFHQELGTAAILAEIEKNRYDLVLLSDYQKGTFSNYYTVRWIVDAVKKKCPSTVIAANPKPPLVKILPHINLLSMNRLEMAAADVIDTSWTGRVDWFIRTLGSEGLDLCANLYPYMSSYSTIPTENPDVVGCGDTVFAAAALAFANGGGFTMDILGKIAVSAGTAKALKKGTATVTGDDILSTLKRIEEWKSD